MPLEAAFPVDSDAVCEAQMLGFELYLGHLMVMTSSCTDVPRKFEVVVSLVSAQT